MRNRLPALLLAFTTFVFSACGGGDTADLSGGGTPAGGAGGVDASTGGGTSAGAGGSAAGAGGSAPGGDGGTGVAGTGPGGAGGAAGTGGGSGGVGGTVADGGDGGLGGGSGAGGTSGSAGSGGSLGCSGGCSDAIPCTADFCVQDICKHAPGACPAGQLCDLGAGCVPVPVCGNDATCTQQLGSDPCKSNIRCDSATATCAFTLLDNDDDQHAPIVCGGDDCDDAHAQAHPGLAEVCDGIDNDCNGAVDDGASCDGALACEGGACVCPAANQCGLDYADKSTSALRTIRTNSCP